MRNKLFLALFALPIASWAAETISWSCGFSNETEIATYVQAKSIGNAILSSGSAASGITCSIDTGSGQSPKANEKYLKIVPGSDAGGYYATIALPEWKPCENWSLSFDYAPSRGGNNNDSCDYGIAVHDTYGRALFSCKGHQESWVSSFTVYKGCDGEQSLFSTNSVGDFSESYNSNTTNRWMRFVLTGSSTGTTLSVVTNLANNAALDLSSSSLGSSFAVPSKILIRTGSYSTTRLQWVCLDDISFTGTAKAFNKIAEYDFEDDEDQAILSHSCQTTTLLETTQYSAADTNWTVVTGTDGLKAGERFVRVETKASAVLTATLPEDVTSAISKATASEVSFDALVENSRIRSSYTSYIKTNGLAIESSNDAILATMHLTANADNSAAVNNIYKGDSTDVVLASGISSSGWGSDGNGADHQWYRFVIRRDSSGTKLSAVNLYNAVAVLDNVSIDNAIVSKILLKAQSGYGTNYACIDNIKVWTYRQGGFVITIADGGEETEKDIESEALKMWLGEYTPDAVNELAKPNASGISPLAAYLLGYATYNADQTAPSLTATATSSGFFIDYDLSGNGEKRTIDGIALEYGISTSNDMENWSEASSTTKTPPVTLAFANAGLYNRLVANIVVAAN